MKIKTQVEILIAFLIVLGVAIQTELLFVYGDFWDWNDLHHETWAIASWSLALGLIIAFLLVARGRVRR